MKTWQVVMTAAAAAGVTVPALAQMAPAPTTRAEVEARVKDRLGKVDADRNGTVTRDEMRSYRETRRKERADAQFAAMDADRNGSVTRAEFDSWQANRGARMAAMRAERPQRAMRMAMRTERRGAMWGQDIVIADAVKRALDRFDSVDINKDGTVTPDERRTAREARRAARG
jgi:hypothetical protein